jgi:hypothetical protein
MRMPSEREIAERLISQVIARTGLSDLRETDPMVQSLRAAGREIARCVVEQWKIRDGAYPSKAHDDDMDEHLAEVLPEGQERGQGLRATGGAVRFSRPTAAVSPIIIDKGTPVYRSKDGYVYRTLDVATIGGGAKTSSPVSVAASSIGDAGNCAANEINRIGTSIPGVTTVANTAAIDNGTNIDSDATAYEWLLNWVRGISPAVPSGILRRVLDIEDDTYGPVRFAKFGLRDPLAPGFRRLYIDDGNGTSGPHETAEAGEVVVSDSAGGERVLHLVNRPIYGIPPVILDGGDIYTPAPRWTAPWSQMVFAAELAAGLTLTAGLYQYYTGLVGVAQRLIDGDVSDPLSTPGCGGFGDVLQVMPANLTSNQLASIAARVIRDQNVDPDTAKVLERRALVQMTNGHDIGQSLTLSDIDSTLRSLSHVRDVPMAEIKINGVNRSLGAGEYRVVRTADSKVTLT